MMNLSGQSVNAVAGAPASRRIGRHGFWCIDCDRQGGFLSALGAREPFSQTASGLILPGRRSGNRVLAAASAAGGAAASAGAAGQAQSQGGNSAPYRVDVHHHVVPPCYLIDPGRERVGSTAVASLWQKVQAWTPEKSIEEMDKNGVATAVTSVSAPGMWFGNVAQGRRIARDCNEYSAKLVRDYPGRFGAFAGLPLPDTEGSLREIEYSLDTLKADGIVLMTNYDNKWPGDASFAPVFEELNRRKAVVFFHPTVAPCCMNLIEDVPDAQIEYLFDTVRAVMSLLYSGTLSRFPDIRFIFAHAGSAVPLYSARIARLGAANPKLAARLPNGPLHEIRKLYYEIAHTYGPNTLLPLMEVTSPQNVMLGSDFPWVVTSIGDPIAAIRKFGFSDADIADIERGNALRLFPRLAGNRALQ
ncbi:MAG: amidohydrolase [Betaproteobacteria bacterium]|nr:amidohydrolase [Betaproteobacteria bacterium]